MAALIQEFNDLGGKTIQEHKRNFCLYMNKLKTLDDTERLKILNNLRAEHRQEEIFLTTLLLKFNQKTKIKELVLQGDRHLNRIIANHKPFVFRDEPISYFMKELFPNVSYVVRNRCLNKMAKIINRDDVGADFFKQVLERYGIKTAQIMLPVCNEAFIKEVLTHYRVVLGERQLIILYQRFGAEFLKFYYIECCKYGMSNQFADQPCLARYLSTKDITTFCQLLKYGTPKIGKKGFLNFLRVKKDDVLNDPTKYSSFIKLKILYRVLTKDEYRVYVLNKLPKKVDNFGVHDITADLKCLHIKYRGSTLESIFKEKYGFEIHSKYSSKDNPDYNINQLKYLLSLEDMLKFTMSDDEQLEYLPPSNAFPLIKERINLTSDMNQRCELVMRLFRCAKNNNDEAALVEALKYLIQRHKNEQSSIREDVFSYMREKYQMEKLGADTWECLHELILTEQMLSQYPVSMREMLEDEILYKFINGMDFTPEFRKWVKNNGRYYIPMPSKNKDLQKWVLAHLPDYCIELLSTEDGEKHWPRSFVSLLDTWNTQNPKDQISFFKYPDVIALCLKHDEAFQYDNTFGTSVLVFPPQNETERKLRDDLIENHLGKFANSEKLWRWLLKNQVNVVEKQIDHFFEKMYSHYHVRKFMSALNRMHYTSLPATVRAKALKLLNDSVASIEKKEEDNPVTSSQRQLALNMLSYQRDFMQIIDNDRFYPSGEAEVDVFDESFKETLSLREQVVECLKNRPCALEVMPILLRFCFKDYFKAALPVLNNVLYNLPEKDLVQPLQILQDRSVSVRKRALFFATTLGTAKTSCDALQYAGENEKNKSLQKFVFNRTFKNFRFVCNQRSWELLMTHFKFVFEKDLETRTMALQFKLIPRSYLPQYVEKVWNHIGKSWENQHNTVMNALNPETMAMLTDALCDDIIHYTLTHSKDQMTSSDVDFIYSYLLSGGEKIDHRFDLVASNARIVADENSQLDFKEFNKKSRNICFLYKDLCRRLMTNDEADESAIHRTEKKMLVNKLAEAFPNLPLPYNHLDYQLQIEVCRCYLDDVAKIPGLIIEMQNDVLQKHGEMMLDYFNDFAASQVDLLAKGDDERMKFVQKLLEADNSSSVKLLAIRLMPTDYYPNSEASVHFRNLLEKIEADSAPIVSLYLNRFLKNLCM